MTNFKLKVGKVTKVTKVGWVIG